MPTEKQLANLKPLNKRTKSEQREICSKGGKKGSETRQIKSTIAQAVKDGLDPVKIAEVLNKSGYSGNLKAIEMIIELTGENPKQKQALKESKARIKQLELQNEKLKKEIEFMSMDTAEENEGLKDFLKAVVPSNEELEGLFNGEAESTE